MEWCTSLENKIHSIKVLNRPITKLARKVIVYEYATGEILGEFDSVAEASRVLHLPIYSCYRAVKGKVKLVKNKYVIKELKKD